MGGWLDEGRRDDNEVLFFERGIAVGTLNPPISAGFLGFIDTLGF